MNANKLQRKSHCYIDARLCTGARFSFCGRCEIAQKENEQEILHATTPLELTAAHIPNKPTNITTI